MSDTTTLWEIDKEVTIAAFAGYLTFGEKFNAGHRAMAEDLFAEIQGRERTFVSVDPDEVDWDDAVWVEVTDET